MAGENPGAADGFDLFGNPIEPIRDRRGRPTFRKDKQNQDFVAVRAAAGWTQAAIAEALGCDEKTLRKYFSRELSGGALMMEGICLDVLLRKVREGHTPSVRALQDRLDRVAAQPAPGKGRGADDGAEKPAPMGKKEQRLADAAEPAADYGDLYDRIRSKARPQ
ncbi:helix-turn-helix transcriptional regulator [Marinibacterium profundimaris]|uniref:Uncharacterized protein n=1 Tax=Marinibacterium profundimaris TaxID=1679460 RepID=A0A225NS18_9RHOB|nr:helix-turn-helix transcriptional regulator [Marinibacterium profundimaris]OWU77609.1 hypothetical protein ATO3_02685 [Marinibacterium profundimaris]